LAVAVAGLKIDHKWLSVAMFVGGLVLALALLLRLQTTSQRARRHRRRVRAPDAADVLREDRRPPVLLLRAFRADELEADAAKPSDLPITFEEFIVQPLERYGPVVAIGRPGDPMPPLGAYREYVAEDWQGRVRELMDAARMIAMVLDDTPGLQWELEQVRDLGLERRLLMIVQLDDVSELGVFNRHEGQQTPASDGIALPPKGKILAVVFDAHGEPLSIIGPYRHAEYYRDAVRLGAKFIRESAAQM
jgi:hypothetical protein